jgi:LmbE family N-acetylglucosaminyl deacetylase
MKILFQKNKQEILNVLCLGSHCDDIEIGCGGTILKLITEYPNIHFYWVIFSSNEQRKQEAQKSSSLFLENVKTKKVIIHNFRDGFLPFFSMEIKDRFEEIKKEFDPDLIFTHYRDDRHQDHRLISELTWNTFRNHLILEYEIPKYDGDLGIPNFFVNLDKSICQRKLCYIIENFESQKNKQWFDEETFTSLLRLRGIESNSSTRYAEAFYCRKICF